MPPEVPTRINVSAPILINSSTAIAVEGQPIPVEVTEIPDADEVSSSTSCKAPSALSSPLEPA